MILKLIKDLTKIGFRSYENELKARLYILNIFKKENINFKIQNFSVFLPKFLEYELKIDNKKINCFPSTFSSGFIKDIKYLHSNLINNIYQIPNGGLVFNPLANSISLAYFYRSPTLTVKKEDAIKILKAKKVEGYVKTQKTKYSCTNILVGDLKKPKRIFLTHYDSLFQGTVDNASGTSLLIFFIIKNIDVLKGNLFVFSGNEELSYDWPDYWSYGYRVFENKYPELLQKTKSIFVVDSLGNSKPKIVKDKSLIKEAIILRNNQLIKKISILTGDIDLLMHYYHSQEDDLRKIKKSYLDEAFNYLKKITK